MNRYPSSNIKIMSAENLYGLICGMGSKRVNNKIHRKVGIINVEQVSDGFTVCVVSICVN